MKSRFEKFILKFFVITILVVIASCVSQKKYPELEAKQRETQDQLNTATEKLNTANDSIEVLQSRNAALETNNSLLVSKNDQVELKYSGLQSDYIHLNEEVENLQSKIDYLSSLPRTEMNEAMLVAKELELRAKQEEINNLNIQKVETDLDWADLSYYCPRKVKEGDEFSLSVVISKVLREEKLKDTLVKRLEFSGIELEEEEIQDHITSLRFKIGDSIRVFIEFQDEDFKIISEEPRTERKINEMVEEWNWRLKAIGPGDHKINVTVENLVEEEWIRKVPRKSFPINVEVDPRSYFYKLWEFVKADPEWPIASLFIPIVTFFAGIWKERRRERQA